MPAKSKKQLKFMQAIANNPAFAKKVGVPTKVGKEFSKEKGVKKANENALMKKVGRNMAKADMQKMNPGMKKLKEKAPEVAKKMVEKDAPAVKRMLDGPQKEAPKTTYKKEYKKGGKVSPASKRGDGCITKGRTRGTMV